MVSSYLLIIQGVFIIPILISLVIVLVKTISDYFNCGYYNGNEKLYGKTVIITGGNKGIGKVTAKEIAKRGAKVILACRNLKTAEETKSEIIKETTNVDIVVKKLDLSSQKSIRQFADDVIRTESRLDILIHNAGLIPQKIEMNEDSLEYAMATNHFGPFLLTHLLIDLLKKSAPSRIIVLSSMSYIFAWLNFYNMTPTTGSWISSLFPSTIYFTSKYANICFTKELARRLEGSGVTANCLHPGMVQTEIWDDFPGYFQFIMKPLRKLFFKTLDQGCQTTLYLACSNDVAGVTGKYFENCKEARVWGRANDQTQTKKIWELSKNLVKLQSNDPEL